MSNNNKTAEIKIGYSDCPVDEEDAEDAEYLAMGFHRSVIAHLEKTRPNLKLVEIREDGSAKTFVYEDPSQPPIPRFQWGGTISPPASLFQSIAHWFRGLIRGKDND